VNRVLDSLRRFQMAQAAAVRRACDALGIPESALNALRVLIADGNEDGVVLRDLSAEIDISPAVATGVIDRLEAKGWAQRRSDPSDRRALIVVTTMPADSPVRRVIRDLDEPLRRVANSITEEQAQIVRVLARSMAETLEAYRPDSGGTGGGIGPAGPRHLHGSTS
jgi:DNA-binding MarR family transcriptional regulator